MSTPTLQQTNTVCPLEGLLLATSFIMNLTIPLETIQHLSLGSKSLIFGRRPKEEMASQNTVSSQ